MAVMVARAWDGVVGSGEHMGSCFVLEGLERIVERAGASVGWGGRRRRGRVGE